ncbi:MAG: hypothetical protein JO037_16895, partial [Actinobacteria bacterium]|nr:hypothetical protein [Actinomycetota bacterium]
MALLTNVASALLAPGRRAGVALPDPGELLGTLRPGRRAHARDGVAVIEVRSAAAGLGDRLARALEEVPGVRWARLNAPLGQVIVGLEPEAPSLAALTAVVTRTEREHHAGTARDDGAGERADAGRPDGSPVDGTAVGRAALALAATGAGLAMSAAGAGLRVARLPAELGSAATVIDSQPRLRGTLESVIGKPAADLGLAVTSALGQGLAGGRAGLAVDLAYRAGRLGELLAARRAWDGREAELLAGLE